MQFYSLVLCPVLQGNDEFAIAHRLHDGRTYSPDLIQQKMKQPDAA